MPKVATAAPDSEDGNGRKPRRVLAMKTCSLCQRGYWPKPQMAGRSPQDEPTTCPACKEWRDAEIAKRMGDQKMRKCLMCGHMFLSTGPGNRHCQPCKSRTSHILHPGIKESRGRREDISGNRRHDDYILNGMKG